MTCAATVVGDIVLLKVQKRLQTMSLDRILRKRGLLQSQTRNLFLQIVVLLPRMSQIDIVRPRMPQVIPKSMKKPLKRCNRRNSPVSDQSHAAAVRHTRFDRTANLHREPDGLGEKNRNQYQDILEPCNK